MGSQYRDDRGFEVNTGNLSLNALQGEHKLRARSAVFRWNYSREDISAFPQDSPLDIVLPCLSSEIVADVIPHNY